MTEGLIEGEAVRGLVLPRRRGGRGWHFEQGRFLTRTQLGKLLSEIPAEWRPFFDLLASTGLRISEAIALAGVTSSWASWLTSGCDAR